MGTLACTTEVETEIRTLPSGRRVEVFRVFAQEGPRGRVLNYFYVTKLSGNKEEAGIPIAAHRSKAHSWFFRRSNNEWRKVDED